MKRIISALTAFGLMLSSAAVLPEEVFSETTAGIIRSQAKEKTAADYTYEITPLLSPFNQYFYVKTDNPDPMSFRFIDNSTVYGEGDSKGSLNINYDSWDDEYIVYSDVVYEDKSKGRVKGGYIFLGNNTDGGEVSLQYKKDISDSEYYDLQQAGNYTNIGEYTETLSSSDNFQTYRITGYYKWEDTKTKVVLPKLVDSIDYLVDTYATKGDFFEKMSAVQSGLDSICLYSGSYIKGEVYRANTYWFLSTSPHVDQSFYIQNPYRRKNNKSLLASALYPYEWDSLSFPSALGMAAANIDPSAAWKWNADAHWMIDVTYNGETRSYGGAGTGEGTGITEDQIIKKFQFANGAEKLDLAGVKSLLDQYGAIEETDDFPHYDDLTWEQVVKKVGENGAWVRLDVLYGVLGASDKGYTYMYKNSDYDGYPNYISDGWADGRYINKWEFWEPGVKFEDAPTASVLVDNAKIPVIDHDGDYVYNEETGYYVWKNNYKVTDVITKKSQFYYDSEIDKWISYDADYYSIKTAVDSGELDKKYLDMITLTKEQVKALNVDRNTNVTPHTSYNYDGTTEPGVIHEEHSFGSWAVTKAATCTAEGSQTRKCSVCGKAETKAIPATGHKYTAKVIAPTYTEQGYTLHTCSVCGESYKDTYKAKLVKTENISSAAVTGITNKTYTGSAVKQTPVVKLGTKTLKSGTDYTVAYKNNTKAGTATLTITGKGSYTGTISKTFKINAASVAKAAVSGLASKAYTGKAITQDPAVKVGGKTLKKGTDYTLSFKNNKAVGTATVTITGKGNYKGSIKKTFKITKASVAKAKVTGISKRYKYTGKAIKPTVKTVKLGGVTLKKGRDYTVSYKNNKKAGTATVTITGKGNYKGTVKKTFKILSAQDYKMWQYTKQVVTLVNKERTSRGLKELKLNEKLYDKAMIRSKEIMQLFSHSRPDGTDCFTVLSGIIHRAAGENIAAGQRTPKEVVNGWMNSPGHRANILRKEFTQIGVGLVYSSKAPYGYYWTQIFIGT